MTILAAYKNSATAKAALHTALDIARETGEEVVVVNAGPGGEHRSKSLITEAEQLELQAVLDASGVPATFRQYARDRSTADEVTAVAAELEPSLVVIGLRRASGPRGGPERGRRAAGSRTAARARCPRARGPSRRRG